MSILDINYSIKYFEIYTLIIFLNLYLFQIVSFNKCMHFFLIYCTNYFRKHVCASVVSKSKMVDFNILKVTSRSFVASLDFHSFFEYATVNFLREENGRHFFFFYV